ncbi:MAG: hypothetical protein ACFE7R_07860 [Candidatus Hodarchaeota archaeon]
MGDYPWLTAEHPFIIIALKPPPAVTSPWDAVDEAVETNPSQKS